MCAQTASKSKAKKKKTVVTDKDHPSLCEISGKIRLRVLEDFFIEKDLKKWKRFKKEWDAIYEKLRINENTSDEDIQRRVDKLNDKSESEKSEMVKRIKVLRSMRKAMKDDEWNIQGKHEREVDAAILKQAKLVRELTLWEKVKNALHIGKRVVPVEIAMDTLLSTIELTSTDILADKMRKIDAICATMEKAGQYKKLEEVKKYRTIIACEAAVIEAGFVSYVTEDTMIEFLRKTERGVMVDFLRYYEDNIPEEVVAKKAEVDDLMVFDNYAIVYYSDIIQKAAATTKKTDAAAEEKTRAKRRDPILFGLIKNSRKLYYICDWVTDTDDLTLEKLEKELGITRLSLVEGADTGSSDNNYAATQDSRGLETDPAILQQMLAEARNNNTRTYTAYTEQNPWSSDSSTWYIR